MSCTGDAGSDPNVLLRDDIGPCADTAVLTDPDRRGTSAFEEVALDVLIFARRAPCRDGGGGGGDFAMVCESWLLDERLGC